MQNNKNIEILEDGYENESSDNHSCRSSDLYCSIGNKSIFNSAPNQLNSIQLLNVESVVFTQPTDLSSLFKQLLLSEELRENFLKGCRDKQLYNKPSFHISAPLSFAESLILEVCAA